MDASVLGSVRESALSRLQRPRSSRLLVLATAVVFAPALLVGCEGANGDDAETVDTTVTSAVTVTPTASWVSRVGLTNAQYQSEFTNWQNKGFRPTYVSGYAVNNQDYYAAIWENSTGTGWTAHHAMNQATFTQQIGVNLNAGNHLAMANGYTVNGADMFVAVWESGTTPTVVAKFPLTAAQVPTTVATQAQQGYRAIQISGYGSSSEEFMVLFKKTTGPKQIVRAGQTSDQFIPEYIGDTNQGYHLTQVNAYSFGGTTHYVSIFDFGATTVTPAPRLQMDQNTYQQTLTELRYQGYRPVNISGGIGGLEIVNGKTVNVTVPNFQVFFQNYVMKASDLTYIDNTVSAVLSGAAIPSVSLAVGKNGRLVFAKAYGFSDTSNALPATTGSLYRLASISKTITSTAVNWLADHGYLSLEKYVFGSDSIFGTSTYPYSNPGCRNTGVPCVEDIKVKDLLAMVAGGWCSDTGSTDPALESMFDACNDNCATGTCEDNVIKWTLQNMPLDVKTETKYGYSNFNYVLLAKIISTITGQPYSDWVRQNLLLPSGITDMQIGNNSSNAKWANEVVYYPAATGCNGPYTQNMHVMEGNGGWISSAIDLVRFMGYVDGLSSPPDLLAPATRQAVISNQAWLLSPNHQADGGYGMGWYLGQSGSDIQSDPPCNNAVGTPACIAYGNGSLVGTNTEMGTTQGGTSWAALANQNIGDSKKDPSCVDPPSPQPQCPRYSLYDDIALPVLNNVTWPSYDLLQQPNLAIYDPPTPGAPSTQCTVGSTTMHCCPSGYVMIGADANQNVFKCAPVLTAATPVLDPPPGGSAYQCNGMHCCPPNQVMVGLRADQNVLACMPLPAGSITTQRVDYKTRDTYPIHVCDAAAPVAAMVGINVSLDQLTCGTDPHLQ